MLCFFYLPHSWFQSSLFYSRTYLVLHIYLHFDTLHCKQLQLCMHVRQYSYSSCKLLPYVGKSYQIENNQHSSQTGTYMLWSM